MSRVEKRKPLPVDPEAVAMEQRRREELNGSDAYQRGVAAAKAQDLQNVQHALKTELDNLRRATVTRDETVAARDRYNRAHVRTVKAAERLALATGQPVAGIPAWLPPPTSAAEATITVGAPKPAAEKVPTAMKDRGEALSALPVFGSALDVQLRGAGVVK